MTNGKPTFWTVATRTGAIIGEARTRREAVALLTPTDA
jgi:hypothetical protein